MCWGGCGGVGGYAGVGRGYVCVYLGRAGGFGD